MSAHPTSPLQVVIASDSLLLREGLSRIATDLGFDVVADAANGDDLVRRVGGLQPDVAIIDVDIPPAERDPGLKAAFTIAERWPQVGILLLSHEGSAAQAVALLEHGRAGRGHLLKERVSNLDAFGDAIRRVGTGASAIDPGISAIGRHDGRARLPGLTARESEILALMATGRSNNAICERLVLSPRTVESHVRAIFQKLRLSPAGDDNRRVLAVLAYLQT